MDSQPLRQTYTSAQNMLCNESADGLLIYDQATGSVHHLNKTARFIWEYCNSPRTVSEIATKLSSGFVGVDPKAIEEDVREIVADFHAKGLLQSN